MSGSSDDEDGRQTVPLAAGYGIDPPLSGNADDAVAGGNDDTRSSDGNNDAVASGNNDVNPTPYALNPEP